MLKTRGYRRCHESALSGIRIALIIALGVTTQVWAAQTAAKDKSGRESAIPTSKSISGKVGAIRNSYISVIYNTETKDDGSIRDWEMLLPIDENLTLTNRQSLSQINEGDEITVGYDETSWVEDGMSRTERKAKAVQFISPAAKGLRSGGN